MKFARLLLRLVVGGFFFGHGTQKLFGWFGGHGLDTTAGFFEAIGARPGKQNAILAGAAEAGGGALLILGGATPIAASALTATMLTAIHRVHLKNGPWATNQGYEYNAVLIAAVLLLAEVGPGPLSIDGDKRQGPGWALFALITGALGAAAAHAYSASQPEPAPEPPAEQQASTDGVATPDPEDAATTA
jgi:putative oxidoreductase